MTQISEKQLRKIRHLLFEAMDKKIIEFSQHTDVKEIQDNTLVNDVVKYVGLEPTSDLTKQLKAEYKTWKQLMNSNVKELREHEKDIGTNI
jgi:arabinogalactan endo-1,4-beta-galactosidase|tara:strand:+ start:165 stop:437 length:273 start_codon:yes stop_codon:yes gene_type:complete